jgi:peptide/nickel transport system substrate-binding protein
MKKEVAWWDRLGRPQYGDEIVFRIDRNIVNFDPYFEAFYTQIMWTWMESLTKEDWTKDPSVFDYKRLLQPNQYRKGQLAESWEFTDSSTFVVHLRKGIHWQDITPVNGREFTADDVTYHFHRLFGLGSGFTPSPDHISDDVLKNLKSVTAIDKYTVVFKWKTNNSEYIMQSLFAPNPVMVFEAREAVEKWGDLSDWHHAIGTGPFILTDFVDGSSATLIKNPNYWGYDERYPQNKLPYADVIKFLIIPDNSEALEAMRTGKIDLISPVSLKDAQAMHKTNPEILQIPIPFRPTVSVDPRVDKAPFDDIKVRKAMQMAIDLPTISKDYYHGIVEPGSFAMHFTTSSKDMRGWGFPYEEWPQDLKDEYAYNPSEAKKLLADAGYPNGFRTNIVADAAGDMDLLQMVKTYFAQVGVDMEIRLMDSVSWHNFVIMGHKHDQMAQCSELPQGHSYDPIRMLHGFVIGHSTHQMINDPVCDTFYPRAFAATSLDESVKIYREANEYIARQHFSISLLQPPYYALCQPWLKGFDAQFGSILMHAVLSFDLGRFWIDQKLKKTMGH